MKFSRIKQRAMRLPGNEQPVQARSIQSIDDLYSPTPKQRMAHETPERFVLYGGSMGSGKSAWLSCEAIFHCLKWAHSRIYLCRFNLSSFRKTTLLTLESFLPDDYVKRHNRNESFIEFKNGSRIFYGGLGDDLKKIEKLKSMELSAFGVDQIEECSEKFFFMLASRLRLNIPGIKYRGWATCNPTSNWVRTRFVENAIADHRFIPALPKENPYLPSSYEEDLRRTLPEELARAWIEGDWTVISSEQNVFSFDEIQAAVKRSASKGEPMCFSVDVARFGGDETVIARKGGNRVTFEKIFAKRDTMQTAGEVIRVVGHDHAVPIKVDSIGVGAGVCDRLREQGYHIVEFLGSASPKHNKAYRNMRAESYFKLKELLPELSLPDDEKLKAQMMAVRYRVLSDGLILIESKEEMKKRGLPSPDRLDAVVMVCSGEQRVTVEEMERYLPIPFHRALQERISEATDIPLNNIPSLPQRSKISHEKWLAEHGLTPQDEADLLRQKISIVGVTKQLPLVLSDNFDFDEEMRKSGCNKIVRLKCSSR